jgi:transposase
LIPIPALSVTGDQIPSQAVLLFVEVQVRGGPCGPCGAITREVHQDIDRTVRHRPVVGKPCDLIFQEDQFLCRRCRHPWVGPLALLSPHRLYTKADEPSGADRCREHRWPRGSALAHLGDDAVEGIYKRVLEGKRSAREGRGVRVRGLDEIAQRQGQRDGVCGLSDMEGGKGSEVVKSRPTAALATSCDGLRPSPRAAIEVVAIDRGEA